MPVKNIDVATLKEWLGKGEVLLVDVREKWEYESAAIPCAVLVPLATVTTDTAPDNTGKKTVFYCRSGIRSLKAAEFIISHKEHLEIYNLTGGILQWAADGNPIEQH